jgi:hypothetical protein
MPNTSVKSSAHTKGPWYIDRQSPHSPICIKPHPGRIVCDVDGTDDEAEANAHLIAAAPDLLDACKMMADWIGAMPRSAKLRYVPDSIAPEAIGLLWIYDVIDEAEAARSKECP